MSTIQINRAPVLTLWGAVVAERLGQDRLTALSLGKCLAGLNAQAKGRMIGIFNEAKKPGEVRAAPRKAGSGEELWIEICGRYLPAKQTEAGVRAIVKNQPIDPAKVQEYLDRTFGEILPDVRTAMEKLALAFDPDTLQAVAYGLYEKFRPKVDSGQRGWGQKGKLDLELIRSLGAPE